MNPAISPDITRHDLTSLDLTCRNLTSPRQNLTKSDTIRHPATQITSPQRQIRSIRADFTMFFASLTCISSLIVASAPAVVGGKKPI